MGRIGLSADFEKLGAFYLGRVFDPEAGKLKDELLLYDSKDLTTHALCVGMTGSGKTGLCIGLLEEAAIDGIPALVIDPKGDLSNLALTFPGLKAEAFEPWVDPGEAARMAMTVKQYAGRIAELWKKGLAEWGQSGKRIKRFRNSAEVAIYTPGSRVGRPLCVLRSLAAPSAAVAEDDDALRDRVQAAVSGLLSLLGITADPIRSREHILLSNLVDRAWREGRDLEIASLIAEIQVPPFERLGVVDLESFFPAAERFELAMSLNSLLASPGFSAWMEGEPLDVGRLLYTPEGRPRLAVLSIAHLSERERMFFVALLLNEVVSWMRSQPGTSSLRALLYMDEVFGYFPPTANPPSKIPMLTLLKQARAYGLGVVLATQNPVDLDYKGLSNCGTWFLGRLQTERDKARVLDGLEGVAASAGGNFDRQQVDRILSGLKSRVFLMNNVHEDRPELFHTRWTLSYLRGPLTREQIRLLSPKKAAKQPSARQSSTRHPVTEMGVAAQLPEPSDAFERALLPPEIEEYWLSRAPGKPGSGRLVYRPALLGLASLHYADARSKCDYWENAHLLTLLNDDPPANPWDGAERLPGLPVLEDDPVAGASLADLPAAATRVRSYASWQKRLKSAAYRDLPLTLFHCSELKTYSQPKEEEGAFRGRLALAARERRDLAVEKLRRKFSPKLARLDERILRAQQRVEREQSQHKQQKFQTVVSAAATVLGALFGRKASSVGRAATTMRGAGRISREAGDVERAKELLEELRRKLDELEEEFADATATVAENVDPATLPLQERLIRPRKADLLIERVALVWTPWSVTSEGIAERLF
ncbi:MAG: DUF87 domain-containing protein [bacterium]|nr:DUF87 domain-containing protein [bacterium]